jgi:O-antigen/teichoic acid export membrane protein
MPYVALILIPADYGVVATATVLIGLARLMGDLGLEGHYLVGRIAQAKRMTNVTARSGT